MRKRDHLDTANASDIQRHSPANNLCVELGQGPTAPWHELGFLNSKGVRGGAYVFGR
jgi:hypothetical protein